MKIVVLDSTSLPGVEAGPGSPAYFSRYVIRRLSELGHHVTILDSFDADRCAAADVVWTEWCNNEAYEAAASKLCKKLIIRMRGFDVFGPLHRLKWQHVDHLVFESPFVKALALESLLVSTGRRFIPRLYTIPGGVDLANIPIKIREHGPVVALVARAIADKGYQLAFEWARQRPNIQLHVTTALGQHNPRLVRYLEHVRPKNVAIHGAVDTVKWLNEINANYLLSASSWEALGYTIAEAMAMGIKPLIHDTPGADLNWKLPTWRSFEDLDNMILRDSYNSFGYRSFVEQHFDATQQSEKFIALLTP